LRPYILFEKYINILALEMASPENGSVPVVSAHFRYLLVIVIHQLRLYI